MAQTLASGVVIPAPGDRISASGVQEMRTLGASVDTGLSLTQAQTAQVDAQSRARDADLADQVAGMEGMTYVGAWEPGTSYRINDVVTHGGDSWARLTAGSDGEPGAAPAAWGLVARKGDGGGFGELTETDVTGLYETVEPEPSVPVSWADLTGKPDTYPPSTHTHPITDVDGLQAIIDRNTVGTGWRNVAAVTTITPEGVLGAGAVSRIKRVGTTVYMEGRGPSGDALLAAKMSTRPTLANLPAGFAAAGYAPTRGFISHDYGATLGILETFTSPSVVRLNFGTRTTNFTAYLNWSIEFETADAWPTVLPGTPA